jgi:hypothetical protein
LRRTRGNLDPAAVQKLPEIPTEAMREPERECSRVKSSVKVSLPALVLSGSI